MSNLRQEISAKLTASRKELSAKSLYTYTSLLFNLAKRLGVDNVDAFSNKVEEVCKGVADSMPKATSAKTAYSALFVLTGNQAYREQMMAQMKAVNERYAQGGLQDKEVAAGGRPTYEQICQRVQELEAALKANPTQANYVNYLAAAVMSGAFFPPRRNEWSLVKVKNYDAAADNYLKGSTVTFNVFKTVKRYGAQQVQLPPALMKWIRKWAKVNPTEYLLFNPATGKPLNSSSISKLLKSLFGVSCDILRSIYVTKELSGIDMRRIMDTATAMGHAVTTQAHVYNRPVTPPAAAV